MIEQTKREEQLNTLTHGLGAIASLIGLFFLITADVDKTPYSKISLYVYGFSLILLFTASTAYHWVTQPNYKRKLRVLDHISIYILIAGTYTPLLLVTLFETSGLLLLKIVWGIALFGVVLKLFFTGRFEVLSTLLYLVMGWLIVVDYNTVENLIGEGKYYLFAGGFFYTVGIIFYATKQIPFNHVIWHVFVLLGALAHYLMVYLYIIQ